MGADRNGDRLEGRGASQEGEKQVPPKDLLTPLVMGAKSVERPQRKPATELGRRQEEGVIWKSGGKDLQLASLPPWLAWPEFLENAC